MTSQSLHRTTLLALVCLIVPVVSTSFAACEGRDVENVGEAETPFTLLLSPAHSLDDDAREQMASFLSSQTGLAIAVEVASSQETAITKFGSAWADAALLPVMSYLFCVQEYGAEAALQVVRRGDELAYVGEIVVRADAEITELADLQGKRIAYVDPYSTTGFLLPAARLRGENIDVAHVFAGGHDEAVAQLRAGTVDAAAVYRGADDHDPALHSIAETSSIPNEPVFFRAGVESDTREAVIAALIAYAGTDAGVAVLDSMADVTGFVTVDDAHYGEVGGVLEAAGQQVEDMVPNGWLIHNENQLSPVDYAP